MKHEIEIPDLPEGWEAVAYRYAYGNEYVLSDGDIEQIRQSISETSTKRLIVRKKQPRRIVLEEVVDDRNGIDLVRHGKYWKIVEDNKCAE